VKSLFSPGPAVAGADRLMGHIFDGAVFPEFYRRSDFACQAIVRTLENPVLPCGVFVLHDIPRFEHSSRVGADPADRGGGEEVEKSPSLEISNNPFSWRGRQ